MKKIFLSRACGKFIDIACIVAMSFGASVVQGCAGTLNIKDSDDEMTKAVEPMLKGIAAPLLDSSKLTKAMDSFYDANKRWPKNFAELQAFSLEHHLDMQLAWMKDIEFTPLEDGRLAVDFSQGDIDLGPGQGTVKFDVAKTKTASGKSRIILSAKNKENDSPSQK